MICKIIAVTDNACGANDVSADKITKKPCNIKYPGWNGCAQIRSQRSSVPALSICDGVDGERLTFLPYDRV